MKKQYPLDLDNKRGAVAILTVVIISVAALLMALSASYLGLGELDLGYMHQKGGEAFSVADGCMEEALGRMRMNSAYTGDSLNFDNGSCIITVIISGNNRTVTVTGTVGNYSRKIESTATLTNNIVTINSWQELST